MWMSFTENLPNSNEVECDNFPDNSGGKILQTC